MDFEKLKLDSEIVEAVEAAGYTKPTKIQEEAIPKILEGKDVLASAQTGSGKTAAFLLPAIQKLKNNERAGKGPKILILTPTRELAQQITVQAEKYSKNIRKMRTVCVVGGIPYHKQRAKLSRPYDILIATPGRLIDYIQQGKMNLSNLEFMVLDEADRMLDMGFLDSVNQILEKTPKQKQTLLFSATLEGEILNIARNFMDDPVKIVAQGTKEKHENIEQKLLYVDNLSHKNELLDHLLNAEDFTSAIIFTATKRHCDELADELEDKGFFAGALHGDMSQRQRSRTIKSLTNDKIQILVATDVAARGIDIPSISHVINFDLPRDIEDYVHRIGRTGRAGKNGIAISFAGSKDIHLVPKIEKFTGQTIKVIEIQGLEPKQKPKATGDKPKSRKSKPRRSSRGGRSESKFGNRGSREGGRSESKFGNRGSREGGRSESKFGNRGSREGGRSESKFGNRGSREGGRSESKFGNRGSREGGRSESKFGNKNSREGRTFAKKRGSSRREDSPRNEGNFRSRTRKTKVVAKKPKRR
ncbi:DEAD/DEAH box helicase [bacterium]|nr:DEAD/DEAH box helicase [bacterium]